MCMKTYYTVVFKKRIIFYHAYFMFKCCVTYSYNCTLIEVSIKFFLPIPMFLRLHAVAILSSHPGGSIIL